MNSGLRRVNLAFGSGQTDALACLSQSGITLLSYAENRKVIHETFPNGSAYYTSCSGLSGAGWIRVPTSARLVGTYRVDTYRVTICIDQYQDGIGPWRILVPCDRMVLHTGQRYPIVLLKDRGSGIPFRRIEGVDITLVFHESDILPVLEGTLPVEEMEYRVQSLYEVSLFVNVVLEGARNLMPRETVIKFRAPQGTRLTREVKQVLEALHMRRLQWNPMPVPTEWTDLDDFLSPLGLVARSYTRPAGVEKRWVKVSGGVARQAIVVEEKVPLSEVTSVSPGNVTWLRATTEEGVFNGTYMQEGSAGAFMLHDLSSGEDGPVYTSRRLTDLEALGVLCGNEAAISSILLGEKGRRPRICY